MAHILIVGSVAWDEVVRLDAPLRPGSHNGGHAQGRRVGGGAANTALALARAGDHASVISAVGADTRGVALLETLRACGVDVGYVDTGGPATTRSLVLLDGAGERTIVNLARAVVPIPEDLARIPADCLYVRSADPALTAVLAERSRRGPVVAHIPPLDEGFRPARVLVGSVSDLDPEMLAAPFAEGRRIAGAVLEWVVLTDGPGGAVAYGPDGTIRQPAPEVSVVDSTGAGDVFAAGLCHALARGAAMETSLRTAVAWGSASVRYLGTIPPVGFPDLI